MRTMDRRDEQRTDDHQLVVEMKGGDAGTADGPGAPGYVKISPRDSTTMRLEGNKLVCNCHDRVILTFDPAALAAYQAKNAE